MVPYSNNQSSLDLILSRENKKTQMEKKKNALRNNIISNRLDMNSYLSTKRFCATMFDIAYLYSG